tara:strand:+ start:193886 stop:194941 length:1056 start_codon:yes stop_codon:yes gene_type:complete
MKAQNLVDAIYEHYYVNYNGEFRGHLGASMGGDPCLRKLWYNFRHATMIMHEGRIQKLFQRGHKEEPTFAEELSKIGIRVVTMDANGQQFRLTCPTNSHVSGSGDGFGQVETVRFEQLIEGEWTVIEMKTHNDRSFKKLEKEGVRASKPLHYSQMQLYMKWSNISKAIYIAVNKNTDEEYVEIIQYDQQESERVEGNMIHVVNSTEAPNKLHNDPSRFDCKYCDYKDICHGDKFKLDVNCRTCVYSEAKPDGTWHCNRYDNPIDSQAGCQTHIINPALLESVATACDYKEGEYLEFEFTNGVKIKNGKWSGDKGIYTSDEIAELVNGGYQAFDENFKLLEAKFGAKIAVSV